MKSAVEAPSAAMVLLTAVLLAGLAEAQNLPPGLDCTGNADLCTNYYIDAVCLDPANTGRSVCTGADGLPPKMPCAVHQQCMFYLGANNVYCVDLLQTGQPVCSYITSLTETVHRPNGKRSVSFSIYAYDQAGGALPTPAAVESFCRNMMLAGNYRQSRTFSEEENSAIALLLRATGAPAAFVRGLRETEAGVLLSDGRTASVGSVREAYPVCELYCVAAADCDQPSPGDCFTPTCNVYGRCEYASCV